MADDAGALLVRSGLVSSTALDEARARVVNIGGTLGEQLVTSGAITDDDLTEFFRARLLVPLVNPNALARLAPKVVASIPSDMAIELRAIPVSLDRDNNLTVAMSDPSDRHAVDEIAFFTGAYVVRAVATQMQIAWCLAHYYGHVTALGQRLLHATEPASPVKAAAATAAAQRAPRAKGLTGKVNAARHRAIAPVTGPVDVIRPDSSELDLRPLKAAQAAQAANAAAAASARTAAAARNASSASDAANATGHASSAALEITLDASHTPVDGDDLDDGDDDDDDEDLGDTPIDLSAMRSTPGGATSSIPRPAAGSPPITAPRLGAGSGRPTPTSVTAVTASTAARAAAGGASTAPLPPSNRAPAAGRPPTASGSAPLPAQSPPAEIPPGAIVPGAGLVPRAAPDATTIPPIDDDDPATAADESPAAAGAPDKPRARSVSGEIRVPPRRAASIRPPMPEADDDDSDDPLIVIEASPDDDATGPRKLPLPRRRAVKSDPPELYARAGEVDLKTGDDRAIDANEPRIVFDEDALAPPPSNPPPTRDLRGPGHGDAAPTTQIDVTRDVDGDTASVIHDRIVDAESAPILLDRPRATPSPFRAAADAEAPAPPPARPDEHIDPDDHDGRPQRADSENDTTGEIIVALSARKPASTPAPTPAPAPAASPTGKPTRAERRTQVGIPPAPVNPRLHRDTEATGVPAMLGHPDADRTIEVVTDPTMIDLRAAPPRDDTTSDVLAAPPAPARDDDTSPHLVAPPPPPRPAPRMSALRAAVIVDDEDDEGHEDDEHEHDGLDADTGEPAGTHTSEMSLAELDAAIPERAAAAAAAEPGHLGRRRIDYDPVDDGWGPPGTTIPPPLLGAIPGSEDDDAPSVIPMPSIDSSPLLVGPPSPAVGTAGATDASSRALARAIEDATARAIEVIRRLERAQSRDEVVDVMVAHLTETHHRAGFFVTRHGTSKHVTELSLFSMTPRPAVLPFAALRLDRPSTLQDVVGTRLPYRGPMHDDDSRSFLISILGACPAEILLVPVAVRERVVGVLFGEHRQRHTFDDQLALAARAAGMALERILKSKRG